MWKTLGLLLALVSAAPQGKPTLERRLALELIDGEAAGVHEAVCDGLLHVWAEGAGDLVLSIERAGQPALEDDDSGGRPMPYLALEVTAGERLALVVRAKEPGAAQRVDLRLVAAPETDATRAAARRGEPLRREARAALQAGDRDAARAALQAALTELEVGADDATSPALAALGRELGYTAYSLGELEAAEKAWGLLYAYRERALPPHHADRLQAAGNFATVRKALGDVAGAAQIEQRVLEGQEASLPEEDETVALARQNLAASLYALGRPREALALSERALTVAERTLPVDHPRIVALRGMVGTLAGELGDVRRARAAQEAELETLERTSAEDSSKVARARMNLGLTCLELGDLAPARASIERALAELEQLYPPEHPDVLVARSSLAGVRLTIGDPQGARVLFEQLLDVRRTSLPADHIDLITTELNLASTLLDLGELEAARALQEAVLQADERRLAPDHPRLLSGRLTFALTLAALGETQRAAQEVERIVSLPESGLAADAPLRLRARLLRARLLPATEERAELAALVAAVRHLPPEYVLRVQMLSRLVASLDGDESAPAGLASEAIGELVEGLRLRALDCLALAPREALSVLASDEGRVANALQAAAPGDRATGRALFELVETRRMIATEVERAASLVAGDPELAELSRTARATRGALNDLVAASVRPAAATAELERLVEERDRAERAIRLALELRGVRPASIGTDALAGALQERSAAVAFLRHPLRGAESDDQLLAFVLLPDAELARIELGSAVEIEALAAEWRTALGAPLAGRGGRGITLGANAAALPEQEPELGAALRQRLLDPVLDAAGDVHRLYVCPDDLVFLVPLDALPDEQSDGTSDVSVARVGDRLQIATLPALELLVRPKVRGVVRRLLLALGDVDYWAQGAAPELALAAAPLSGADRSGPSFAALPETALELTALEEVLGTSLAGERVVLRGADASKAALVELAPGARYLHFATHGWFAGEQQRSVLDPPGLGDERSFDEAVAGFAPLTLCGLALAGAARGADALGHVPGILTAEELVALDLSACELAVLSACETNVGLRRAGQGIRSFQSALHSAGVQTAITSLWKVDDTATRNLMERFYAALWREDAPPLDALWSAKQALRRSGAPPRDWAGWVLSGDPE